MKSIASDVRKCWRSVPHLITALPFAPSPASAAIFHLFLLRDVSSRRLIKVNNVQRPGEPRRLKATFVITSLPLVCACGEVGGF